MFRCNECLYATTSATSIDPDIIVGHLFFPAREASNKPNTRVHRETEICTIISPFPGIITAEGGASGEVYADAETGITVSFCGIIRSEKDTSRIAENFNLN
jgi:hypothetical protein